MNNAALNYVVMSSAMRSSSTSGGGKLSPEHSAIAGFLFLAVLYLLIYMVVTTIADKYDYGDLSLFGKIVFFPIGLGAYIIKKLF